MKNNDFEKHINSMQEKLGKESTSLIADDFGTLITDNALMNSEIEQKNKEIEKLKKDKENLQNANMNLLQQIPMGDDLEGKKEPEENKPRKPFDMRDAFDEHGNFKDKI